MRAFDIVFLMAETVLMESDAVVEDVVAIFDAVLEDLVAIA